MKKSASPSRSQIAMLLCIRFPRLKCSPFGSNESVVPTRALYFDQGYSSPPAEPISITLILAVLRIVILEYEDVLIMSLYVDRPWCSSRPFDPNRNATSHARHRSYRF